MTSSELENLVGIGKLKREPPSAPEFEGLLRSREARLADASNPSLAPESRSDLAYNAAHALALAALRRLGYRSESRYLVFQTLPHTLGLPTDQRLTPTPRRAKVPQSNPEVWVSARGSAGELPSL